MELLLHGGETRVSSTKGEKEGREERERERGGGLQHLRGGLLLPLEAEFRHPREPSVVQVLSKPRGRTYDEARCLAFVCHMFGAHSSSTGGGDVKK